MGGRLLLLLYKDFIILQGGWARGRAMLLIQGPHQTAGVGRGAWGVPLIQGPHESYGEGRVGERCAAPTRTSESYGGEGWGRGVLLLQGSHQTMVGAEWGWRSAGECCSSDCRWGGICVDCVGMWWSVCVTLGALTKHL